MPPLFDEDDGDATSTATADQNGVTFHFSGTSVESDSISVSLTMPTGPGTELLAIFKSMNVPTCPDCIELAQRMNRWKADGCEDRIGEIVAEILPRALAWIEEDKRLYNALLSVADKIPFVSRSSIVSIALKRLVKRAISNARKSPKKKQVAVRSVPRSGKRVRRESAAGKRFNPIGLVRGQRDDISNLILSTTFGPEPRVGQPIHAVTHRPFSGEPIRHLLYHIYPVSDLWRWNLDQLLERIDLFTGRRIVAISVDRKADDAAVRRYLGRHVQEYLVIKNDANQGEMVSFVPQIAQLQTNSPNEVTFRAHAKGVVQKTRPRHHIKDWVDMLYCTNLDDWPLVKRHLLERAMTGACRSFSQFSGRSGAPSYSGSFYWFRNCYVYSRTWDHVLNKRWGCEEWPGRLFTGDETACLFLDNTNSMYSEYYWENTVKPSYEKWKRERGLACS